MPITNNNNLAPNNNLKKLVLLLSKLLFIVLAIFILINIDYKINNRTYSPFIEKNHPEVVLTKEDELFKYYKVTAKCESKKSVRVGIQPYIDKNILAIIDDNDEKKYGREFPRLIEFKVKKNEKISFQSTCGDAYLPIEYKNYNF
jgi:hypothetical protein